MKRFPGLKAAERLRWCEEAGARLGLEAPSVEKDFWVCWTLRELFDLPEIGAHLTFKGGTSLSKCWKLIERFSEDVDVVVSREYLGFTGDNTPERASSNSARERRLAAVVDACKALVQGPLHQALEERCRTLLPSGDWELSEDPDDGDGQTLLLRYPTVFEPGGYLRRLVKIELGARSDTEPSLQPALRPYLTEAFPDDFRDSEFSVRTLSPERTFWEKAMLLHEEVHSPGPDDPRPRLSRHYYDLWCLIRSGVAERAAGDRALFDRVAAHRRLFFRRKRAAQDTLRPGQLSLVPSNDQVAPWRRDYEAMRQAMFFRDPPGFDEIMRVVGEFQDEFNRR